jgi:DNA-binding NarL/FixJ family response regulator
MSPSRKPPIRVIIADDQPLQRQGYRMVIDSQRDAMVVGEASDGIQALTIARQEPADVVLMDIQMPRVNGLVAAERIATDPKVRELGRPPRVILLTAVDVDGHLAEAAAAGAFAVLFKDIAPEDLLGAIRGAAAHVEP